MTIEKKRQDATLHLARYHRLLRPHDGRAVKGAQAAGSQAVLRPAVFTGAGHFFEQAFLKEMKSICPLFVFSGVRKTI